MVAFLAAVLCTAVSVSLALAQDEAHTRATLQGLKGVHGYVEELKPEIEAEGLKRSEIQEDAEREVSEGGVPVLSQETSAEGAPYLYVYLHVFKLPTQTRRYSLLYPR